MSGTKSKILKIGDKINNLTILSDNPIKKLKRKIQILIYYSCKCDCGKVKDILGSLLKSGLDSNLGYTKDNICLVYKDINFMKQDFGVEKFIHYCRLVVDTFKDK